MVIRTRNKTVYDTGFETHVNPVGSSTVLYPRDRTVMSDVADGYGAENPLELIRSSLSGSSVTGVFKAYSPRFTKRTWDNYPTLFTIDSYNTFIPSFPESDAALSARFLAGTAPERQEILLPAFLAELRDIPRTVKYGTALAYRATILLDDVRAMAKHTRQFGSGAESLTRWGNATGLSRLKTSAKELGQANIAWRFGVAPFIADLRRLVSFQDAVDKRRQEIDRLHSGRGLKRTWTGLGNYTDAGQLDDKVIFAFGSIRDNIQYRNEARRWASIRWKPTRASILPPNDAELRRMILGLTTKGVLLSAYELLPWSWLIDYFFNLGTVLEASANSLTYEWAGSIMKQTKSDLSHPARSVVNVGEQTDFRISPGRVLHEQKHRTPMSGPHLSWVGDELSGSQLSILGSLVTSRLKR